MKSLWVFYGFGQRPSFNVRVMFLFCWRISMVCLALKFVGSWVELGFKVSMETFGCALVY